MRCYLLPTHRHGSHRKFYFIIPSYFKIEYLSKCCSWVALCNKWLIAPCCKIRKLCFYITPNVILIVPCDNIRNLCSYTTPNVLFIVLCGNTKKLCSHITPNIILAAPCCQTIKFYLHITPNGSCLKTG